MTPQTLGEALKNPDTLIEILQRLKAEQEKSALLETTVQAQSQTIAEMKPKASYYDVVLNCKDLLSVTQIAKDYGKSAVWLNEFLHKKHVQFKQGKCWFLYQRYAEQGYTSTKTQTFNAPDGTVHTKVHMYWTQKGRLFLYDLLKSEGVLPLMEQ
jgi:phage antirepressor YoqD-like protein